MGVPGDHLGWTWGFGQRLDSVWTAFGGGALRLRAGYGAGWCVYWKIYRMDLFGFYMAGHVRSVALASSTYQVDDSNKCWTCEW